MANDDSMSVDKKHNEEEKDENDEDYEDDDDDDYEDEEDDDEDYEDEDDDEEDQSNQTPFMSALHASIKQAPPLFTRPEPSACKLENAYVYRNLSHLLGF